MKNYFYFQLQYEVTTNSYKKVTNKLQTSHKQGRSKNKARWVKMK